MGKGWITIKTDDDLPPEGEYVLARHNRGTWRDSTDQENVNCVVVKLVRGISKETRKEMEAGIIPNPIIDSFEKIPRSDYYMTGDEDGNNLKPYEWRSFGAKTFFGQSIICWMPIEPYSN